MKKIKFSLGITVLYALIILFLIPHHEPFSDEINVYMILKNMSGTELWSHVIKDGNPPGFFILLYPLVKAGASFFSIQILCALFCIAAVFIFNCISPFSAILNILITFSSPMLYFFPIIARCYSLLPFLIFSVAATYKLLHSDSDSLLSCFGYKVSKKLILYVYALLIAMIAQNHVIMFGFVSSLVLLFCYEEFYQKREFSKDNIAALLIMLLPMAAIVIQCFIALPVSHAKHPPHIMSLAYIYDVLSGFFCSFFYPEAAGNFFSYQPPDSLIYHIMIFFSCSLLVFFFFIVSAADLKYGLALIISSCFPILVFVLNRPEIMPNKSLITHLFIVFFMMISFNKLKEHKLRNKIAIAFLYILFVASFPSGISFYIRDLKYDFSAASKLSQYIKKHIPESDIIISFNPWVAVPVVYYSNRAIYQSDGKKIICIPFENIEKISSSVFNANENTHFYIMVPKKYKNAMSSYVNYYPVFETDYAILSYEDYVLYLKS